MGIDLKVKFISVSSMNFQTFSKFQRKKKKKKKETIIQGSRLCKQYITITLFIIKQFVSDLVASSVHTIKRDTALCMGF